MSCFIHHDSAFEAIARTLGTWAHGSIVLSSLVARIHTFPEAADKPRIEAWIERLRHYNYDAMNERYRERVEYVPLDFKHGRGKLLKPIELYKLLQSINYQCCDSTAYHASKFADEVEEIINLLGRHIINALPEYDAAEWAPVFE